MSPDDTLLHHRLHRQRLHRSEFSSAAEVVSWLGAVQSQDFAGAKWGLALRARGLSNATIDAAFDAGAILRTHVLRPTWHFVAPADIRWMLSLTAPRVNAVNAFYYRQWGIDDRILARSRRALERALHDGTPLTRSELRTILARAGIEAAGPRLALIVMRAELDALICSGPRRGRQFTYMLLDRRAAPVQTRTRDESLRELTCRYFSSHGPATVRDFAWWSGLTVRDVQSGLDFANDTIASEQVGGLTYWRAEPVAAPPRRRATAAHLLPNYDEYLIAYKDRDPVLASVDRERSAGAALANHLVIDGRLAGSWKRTEGPRAAALVVKPFRRLTDRETAAVEANVARYRAFSGLPVTFTQA